MFGFGTIELLIILGLLAMILVPGLAGLGVLVYLLCRKPRNMDGSTSSEA